jgi:hypothetical protein
MGTDMRATDITIANRLGGFRFTRGTYFFAGGVVAESGYEIVRARLERPLPLAEGLEGIRHYLTTLGRPMQALCGVELRAPRPYPTRAAFATFNAEYVDRLRSLNLIVDGLVPLTRANLAIDDGSVKEQCVYAFVYTVSSSAKRPTFATSAQADLKHLSEGAVEHVAGGDTSPRGLTEKVRYVVHRIDQQLADLGVSWAQATQIGAYAVHPIGQQIAEVILPMVGPAARQGVTWHFVLPPVVGLDFELDVRGLRQDLVVDSLITN